MLGGVVLLSLRDSPRASLLIHPPSYPAHHLPPPKARPRASLLIHPPSYPAHHLPPLRRDQGRAFLYTLRHLSPTIFSPPYASKRGSKSRVGEQVDRLANQGRAFSYTRHRFSPPFSPPKASKRGSKTRVGEQVDRLANPPVAKPSSTSAVVLRPPFFFSCTAEKGRREVFE